MVSSVAMISFAFVLLSVLSHPLPQGFKPVSSATAASLSKQEAAAAFLAFQQLGLLYDLYSNKDRLTNERLNELEQQVHGDDPESVAGLRSVNALRTHFEYRSIHSSNQVRDTFEGRRSYSQFQRQLANLGFTQDYSLKQTLNFSGTGEVIEDEIQYMISLNNAREVMMSECSASLQIPDFKSRLQQKSLLASVYDLSSSRSELELKDCTVNSDRDDLPPSDSTLPRSVYKTSGQLRASTESQIQAQRQFDRDQPSDFSASLTSSLQGSLRVQRMRFDLDKNKLVTEGGAVVITPSKDFAIHSRWTRDTAKQFKEVKWGGGFLSEEDAQLWRLELIQDLVSCKGSVAINGKTHGCETIAKAYLQWLWLK
jgi:hypothetical protein